MASSLKRPTRPDSECVSYKLMARFSELLICGRCFSRHVRKPVRQLMSSHHRPLGLCHECSREVLADHKAQILKMN